jgi:hypothetical protein
MIFEQNIIVGNNESFGVFTIDVDKCIKSWSKLWVISKYNNSYALAKFKRKNSELRWFKLEISKKQAEELITKLKLKEKKSEIFINASTWRSE